jgi:hypothetical protein
MSPAVSAWLARAVADAKARNLPELAPLLESLAKSLQGLRDADEEFAHPAVPLPATPLPLSAPSPDADDGA